MCIFQCIFKIFYYTKQIYKVEYNVIYFILLHLLLIDLISLSHIGILFLVLSMNLIKLLNLCLKQDNLAKE